MRQLQYVYSMYEWMWPQLYHIVDVFKLTKHLTFLFQFLYYLSTFKYTREYVYHDSNIHILMYVDEGIFSCLFVIQITHRRVLWLSLNNKLKKIKWNRVKCIIKFIKSSLTPSTTATACCVCLWCVHWTVKNLIYAAVYTTPEARLNIV